MKHTARADNGAFLMQKPILRPEGISIRLRPEKSATEKLSERFVFKMLAKGLGRTPISPPPTHDAND
jgi:hypothetical protein